MYPPGITATTDLDAARRIAKTALIRRSPLALAETKFSDYRVSPAHRVLDDALMRLHACMERGEPKNLMVFMPPRVGKSVIVSETFPGWFLGHHPDREVLCCSATQDLANFFGRRVRASLADPIYQGVFPQAQLSGDSNAADELALLAGGTYKAAGVGSQIVGRGGDLIIIDDPIKNREMADSETQRRALRDWYTSSLLSRQLPHTCKVLMHQRWHPDDLAGWLLAQAKLDPMADQWEVLVLPALDPRTDESNFPERFSTKHYHRLRASMQPRDWLAMYQQSPVVEAGSFFLANQFKWGLPPEGRELRWIVGADFAVSTSTYSNHTAAFGIGIDQNDDIFIHPNFVYGRYSPRDAVTRVFNLAKGIGATVVATDKGPIDAALADTVRAVTKELSYYPMIKKIQRSSAKHIMAAGYQGRCQQGKVTVPNTEFFKLTFVPQHLNFVPDADGDDDCIDAMTNGVQALAGVGRPKPVEPVAEEDVDPWDAIMRRASPVRSTGIRKLNGDAYASRTSA